MSILVGKDSKVVTQGITGSTGQFHTRTCKEYGTNMVAGVTPGKGGGDFEGIPVYDTVGEARATTPAGPWWPRHRPAAQRTAAAAAGARRWRRDRRS